MKLSLCLVFLCCLCTSALAADVTKQQCNKDARDARTTAIAAALTGYQDALTSCRGPCFEACKNAFGACIAPFNTAADQCNGAAEIAFATSLAACKTSTNCGTDKKCYTNRDFQLCLVDPRVLRRSTIQACNKTQKDGIKTANCAATRKNCNKACEPVR